MCLKSLLCTAAAGAALSIAICGQAFAAGFYVQEQSVRGLGRAYSGEGADTGAASLWWNPAAIGGQTGLGDAYIGVHRVSIDGDINDAGSTIQRPVPGLPVQPVGGAGAQHDPFDTGVIPNLGASWRLNDQWALGVSVNAPFNFVTRYPLNSWTRYQALKSDLFNIDIQPTIAWTPTPELSIGAGFDFDYTRATLSNALPNPSPLLPDASSVLTGKGWNHGWVAGLDWRPDPMVTLGLSYRSGIHHTLNGTVTVAGLLGPAAAGNFGAPASADFKTPSILTGSARFKITDQLTLNAQVQHFDWSVFNAINVAYGSSTQVIPQNYVDTTSVAGGLDYVVDPMLTLRAGVQRDPTPTPDVGRTARVPDASRWIFAGGATFAASAQASVDVGVAYIAFDSSSINSNATAFSGTPLNTPIAMLGTVNGHGLVLSAGLRLKF